MRMRVPKRGTKNGNTALTIFPKLTFAISFVINNTIPKGGVNKPSERFNTITKPNTRGSTPIATAGETRIGPKMRIAAIDSKKQPIMRKKILIIIKNIVGVLATETTHSANATVRPERARTHP